MEPGVMFLSVFPSQLVVCVCSFLDHKGVDDHHVLVTRLQRDHSNDRRMNLLVTQNVVEMYVCGMCQGLSKRQI